MNWFYIAIAAQVILGVSAVFDKWLLKKRFFDPLVYTFWFAVMGYLAIFLMPFGFAILPIKTILIAFASAVVFVFAMYFLFLALSKSEASKIYPLIGGFSPIFTLIVGYMLLDIAIGVGDIVGFIMLILGAFVLFFIEEKELVWSVFLLVLASSVMFGISHTLSKIVFQSGPFIAGYVWIKIGEAIFATLFLLIPKIRKNIFSATKTSGSRDKVSYFANRAFAAAGSILVNVAFSLTHPALVDATQSLKYVVIFLVSWVLLKEHFKGKVFVGKILATIFVVIGLAWLGLVGYARNLPVDTNRHINWGVTFSQKFSRQLGLDWQKNYEAILNDLNPSKLRLVAYWDDIEKIKGQYEFSDTDWLLEKSAAKNKKVILVVGMKVPRWPECFIPDWANNLSPDEKEIALRDYLKNIVERYKNNSVIESWQAENEPFLDFGECDKRPDGFLDKEISLIKSIDNKRPIVVSDSGEFGLWYKAVQKGDVFGTTMYRKVYSPSIGWLTGVIEYPLEPSFFKLKEKIVRRLTGEYQKKFFVSELQAEPWDKREIPHISYARQIELFSPDYFADTINYAKATGFDEYYLWGAEWWYKLKTKNNDERYWEYAKKVISGN
ncbi:MAG: EamA family transporter [Candidatus Wolfebacteria bacterium]|nr:EamA family transporter [Candidatus Wolfebacteria bacterium]